MGFNSTKNRPAVTVLSIHDSSSSHHVQYQRNTDQNALSTLNHYFARPVGTFVLSSVERNFDDLTYAEYFSLFRLAKRQTSNDGRPGYFIEQLSFENTHPMHVILRSGSKTHLSRIQPARPSQGELFYLRALIHIRPARSFIQLRTVDDHICPTYQDATTEMGLFASEKEATYALIEAIQSLKTP